MHKFAVAYGLLVGLAWPAASPAAETGTKRVDPRPQLSVPDSFAVEAYSVTYAMLMQRAVVPGPAGAIAAPATECPVYEYGLLRFVDVDTRWAKNSLDAEVSFWGAWAPVRADTERVLDGDVSVAQVTHRLGRAQFRLGRQYVTEGAARFAHLDGVSASVRSEVGIAVSGYAGLTVLPRWRQTPSYRLLGSASDSMVDRPEDLPRARRSGSWMVGARAGYSLPALGELGISLHEQREDGELGRRDAALDLHLPGSDRVDGSGRVLVDLDSGGIADAFVGLAVHPWRRLDASVEYRRMMPALLMSRQSVLSVFAVDPLHEVGGELRYRPNTRFLVFAGTFVDVFETSGAGARTRGGIRATPDDDHRWLVNASYTRVTEPTNGYHSTRLSLQYRFSRTAVASGEQYAYLYDVPIRGAKTSTVHALTASYRLLPPLTVALSTSVFSSPYASLDLQGMVRVSYAYGAPLGGEP